jgi:hypothetical protein
MPLFYAILEDIGPFTLTFPEEGLQNPWANELARM